MDERHDEDQGNSDNESAAAKATPAAAEGETPASADSGTGKELPMIEAPQLGGGEAVEEPAAEVSRADHDAADHHAHVKSVTGLPMLFREPVREAPRMAAAGPGSQPRSFRFAVLAGTIACAAGVGALAGSLTASGIGRQPAAQPIARAAESRDIVQALKIQRAEISALKASLDSESRTTNGQFGKIADRLNGLEHAQADASNKFARMAEAVDRLSKKTAATPEITGSIAAPPAAPAARPNLPAVPVLRDWVVQDVRNGRAMVETRYGSMFLVASGGMLPGLGRVAEIKRQNGAWIVVTERGLITSNP